MSKVITEKGFFAARLAPHLLFILSLDLLTLYVFDRFNPAMAFISNEITRYSLLVYGVLLVICPLVISDALLWQKNGRKSFFLHLVYSIVITMIGVIVILTFIFGRTEETGIKLGMFAILGLTLIYSVISMIVENRIARTN